MNVAFTFFSSLKFYDLSENFEQEGYKIIDTYIFQGTPAEVAAALESFTKNFLEYAKEKDPNLGLVYVYNNGTDVYVNNRGPTNINTITKLNPRGEELISPNVLSISEITLQVGEKETKKEVKQKQTAFGAVNKAAFANANWVVLNIAGSFYSFNTANDENFYIIATTTVTTPSGTAEEYVYESEDTPSPQKCDGTCISALLYNKRCKISGVGATDCENNDCCPTNHIIDCLESPTKANPNMLQWCDDGNHCAEINGQKKYCKQQEISPFCNDGFDNDGDGDWDGGDQDGQDGVEDPNCIVK